MEHKPSLIIWFGIILGKLKRCQRKNFFHYDNNESLSQVWWFYFEVILKNMKCCRKKWICGFLPLRARAKAQQGVVAPLTILAVQKIKYRYFLYTDFSILNMNIIYWYLMIIFLLGDKVVYIFMEARGVSEGKNLKVIRIQLILFSVVVADCPSSNISRKMCFLIDIPPRSSFLSLSLSWLSKSMNSRRKASKLTRIAEVDGRCSYLSVLFMYAMEGGILLV